MHDVGLEVDRKDLQSLLKIYEKSEIKGLHFLPLIVNSLSQRNLKNSFGRVCTLGTSYVSCMMYLGGLEVG